LNTQKKLADKHRAEFDASGISIGTTADAGIYSVSTNAEVREVLGWQPKFDWGTGWVVPFDGTYSRFKPDHPRPDENGKPIKYESPPGAPSRAYFPPGFEAAMETGKPLLITEGEKKALAISQLGYACVGLVGVWNFLQPKAGTFNGKRFGKRSLIEDIAKLKLSGRRVVICFDSDVPDNPSSSLAESQLATLLMAMKAETCIARLPQSGDEKAGADDYLVARGEDAFRNIIDNATPAEKQKMSVMTAAEAYLAETFTSNEGSTLCWWQSEFYRWTGKHYRKLDAKELSATVLMWLSEKQLDARPRLADDTTKCLGAICREPFEKETPCLRARLNQ
jgi:Domain of unknown function (DUF3854)